MWNNTDQLSHYESSFGFQRPTLSLFVKTNDSTRQLIVCCRRDETIKSVCKTIANIYFKTFMSEDCSDDSDVELDNDFYYLNFENNSVIVDHLEFDGYVLPALHKVGDLLENKAVVTARIRLTGKPTRKTSKSKTKSKPVKKEEKVKIKKEPKEKKPKQAKMRIRDESEESLETPKKKVKKPVKKNEPELIESETEKLEEEKLDVKQGVRHDDSEIEEMIVKPKMQVESPAKKKAAAAKKKSELENKKQKKDSAKKEAKPKKEQITIDGSDSEESPVKPRKPPVKLQPSKTIILAGMNEKMFGGDSEEEEVKPVAKPKMQVESATTKKPAAATTTTAQAQPETKTQVEDTKKEEKPKPVKKMSMTSNDSLEFPKKKTTAVETKKANEAKIDVKSESEEEIVKPSAKPKMQVEPPAPPASAKDKSQTMKPPEDKSQKKKAPIEDLKKKNIDDFVNNLSGEDSDEVPSPKASRVSAEKERNGTVEQNAKTAKPKVDPIVVVPAVATPQEEAKAVAVKTVEKIDKKELVGLSNDNNMEIPMTKSVYTVGPPKIGEVTAFRKLSTQEQIKPIVQEDSPVVFKIHELIDSEEEKQQQQKKSAKKSAKKSNDKEKGPVGGKQGPQQQKKTQNIVLESPSASENEPKKLNLNGNEKGKGKQAAKTNKKKKRSLSSSSSSDSGEDTKKSQRNVNLFQ